MRVGKNAIPSLDRFRIRRVLYRAQGGICTLCGTAMPPVHQTNIDHTISRPLDGADALGNLTCTHRLCNSLKADRPPTGCELIWLLAVNCRLGIKPDQW